MNTARLTLQDADPTAWRRPNKPDLSPAEMRLGAAARRFSTAADALEAFVAHNPTSGAEYDRHLEAWETGLRDLFEAAWGFPAGGRSFRETGK